MATNYTDRPIITTNYSDRPDVISYDYTTWNECTETWNSVINTWDNYYTIITGTQYTDRPII